MIATVRLSEVFDIDPAVEIRQDQILRDSIGDAYLGGRLVRRHLGFIGLSVLSNTLRHQRTLPADELIKLLTSEHYIQREVAKYFLEGGE